MQQTIATAIFCFIAAAEEQPSEATQPKAARGTMAVAPLPVAEYADTEVSTISVRTSPMGLKVVIE